MSKLIDGDAQGMSRRVVLRGVSALLPGLILTVASVPAAASVPATVQGALSASAYTWPVVASQVPTGQAASGVAFTLTAGGLPLAGQRVRFSISSFHAVGHSVWFETSLGRKSVNRLGYLDLDTDESGTVVLDQWLRRGAVPTTAMGELPQLRAQLVGSETILASAHIFVAPTSRSAS